jgi:hypothetical protein
MTYRAEPGCPSARVLAELRPLSAVLKLPTG